MGTTGKLLTLRTWLVALLPVVPGVATLATLVLFLADWPYRGNHGLQLAVALGVATLLWIVAAVLFGPDLTGVRTASSTSYEDLRGRVIEAEARVDALHALPRRSAASQGALAEAHRLLSALRDDLDLDGRDGQPAESRWLLGHGYVNAWRELQEAEDRLLVAEGPEYATAVVNGDPALADWFAQQAGVRRLARHQPITSRRFKSDRARELLGRRLYILHTAENDAWDQIVNMRNRLFLTLVLAVSMTYALVALLVLRHITPTAMTAAIAFFLAGSIVGVFNELYLASRPSRAKAVFDYGLGHIRLLVTPVLSGLAGVGGVLLTTLTGPFLIHTAGTPAAVTPSLVQIFSLSGYSMGLIVAAIFGLTPGLLLTRLHARSETYKEQIQDAAPTSIKPARATAASRALVGST